MTLNANRQNSGYLNHFCGENPFFEFHTVYCAWIKMESEKEKKINSEDIAGGVHITFCIKVRPNLTLIIIPKDDSLEPLSLANPGKTQTLKKTKAFESHCLTPVGSLFLDTDFCTVTEIMFIKVYTIRPPIAENVWVLCKWLILYM